MKGNNKIPLSAIDQLFCLSTWGERLEIAAMTRINQLQNLVIKQPFKIIKFIDNRE